MESSYPFDDNNISKFSIDLKESNVKPLTQKRNPEIINLYSKILVKVSKINLFFNFFFHTFKEYYLSS
jgi:hypothetical protein